MTDRADRRAAWLLFALAFLVFNANLRPIAAGDSRPARFLPFLLLGGEGLTFDAIRDLAYDGDPGAYWLHPTRYGLVSRYPIVTPLLATPLYLPAALALSRTAPIEEHLGAVAEVMEKLSASVLAALSVGLLYLLLLRRSSPSDAALLTVAYAFATNTWTTSGQALWQQAGAELLLVVALLASTAEVTTGSLAASGLACGLLVANRPTALSIAAVLLAYTLPRAGRRIGAFLAPAAVVAGLLLLYNLATFGSLTGGYGTLISPSFFSHGLFSGLAGLLVSPGKGLFVYSPFLLFLLWPVRRQGLDRYLVAAFLLQLLTFAPTDITAGYCYGPRFLVDSLPLLVLLLAPVVAVLGRASRAAFVLLVAAGVAVQAIGAFCYPRGASDVDLKLWSVAGSPILREARAGPAPMRFLGRLGSPPEAPPVLGLVLRASARARGPLVHVTASLAPIDATPPPGLRVSLDVYALEAPSHPDRHYAVWHLTLPDDTVPLDVGLDVDLVTREARITWRGRDVPSEDPRRAQWTGTIVDGAFVARLVIERPATGELVALEVFSFRRRGERIAITPAPTIERRI